MFIQFSGEILKLGERTAGMKQQKEIEGFSRTDREEKERFDIYIFTDRYVIKDGKRYEISNLETRKIILSSSEK